MVRVMDIIQNLQHLEESNNMSERITSIRLKDFNEFSGVADWGLKSHEEMLEYIKQYAQRQKNIFDKILEASDDEFITETYLGVHVKRNIKLVLPKGV